MSPRKRPRKRTSPSTPPPSLRRGDSVAAKPGTLDPDFGIDIGGWQGRVVETRHDKKFGDMVCIEWDSVTLRQVPESTIVQSEEQGIDWRLMWLGIGEVEAAPLRDRPQDVAKAQQEIAAQSAWLWLGGEQGRRVQKVLAGIDEDDDVAAVEAWEAYLEQRLDFPFEAEVAEYQDRGPLQAGDRVTVTGISLADDHYGIIVSLRHGRQRYDFPLCDLEVSDKDSPNYQHVDDYSAWFANR
jgi:hypothetical protein